MPVTALNEDFYRFIEDNANADTTKLRLKARKNPLSFNAGFAITQIECRAKAKRKLPEITADKRFLFPSLLSTEQCTSEPVAKLHAKVIGKVDSLLDITAGLGIDDYYIASQATTVVAVERDSLTAEVAQHNFARLRGNITVVNCPCERFIAQCLNAAEASPKACPEPAKSALRRFGAVFADPARRAADGRRVFGLGQCEPAIIPLLPQIAQIAPLLYIKASPMLDITQSLRELDGVTDVWVISLRNECLELLFKINFSSASQPAVHCLNINSDGSTQELTCTMQENTPIPFAAAIKTYLYEPNASIMKAGAFHALASRYPVEKIAPSSHLFTAESLIEGFPGRAFRVVKTLPYNARAVKRELRGVAKINVAVRNFRLDAEELKQRLGLKDGGDCYLFGTTLATGEMVVALCDRV